MRPTRLAAILAGSLLVAACATSQAGANPPPSPVPPTAAAPVASATVDASTTAAPTPTAAPAATPTPTGPTATPIPGTEEPPNIPMRADWELPNPVPTPITRNILTPVATPVHPTPTEAQLEAARQRWGAIPTDQATVNREAAYRYYYSARNVRDPRLPPLRWDESLAWLAQKILHKRRPNAVPPAEGPEPPLPRRYEVIPGDAGVLECSCQGLAQKV
jgi:hypothetical protein